MIAHYSDRKVTSEEMAESAGCNAVVIRNLFTKLKRAGLLSVKVGRGKTALAKSLEEITLWDVYVAVESLDIEDIFPIRPSVSDTCPVGGNIHTLLERHLENAVNAMKEELSRVSLGDVKEELDTHLQRVGASPCLPS
jgi:DNA-binding IscR family transcriptional regulator